MTAAVQAGALSHESALAADEYREVDVITSAGPARWLSRCLSRMRGKLSSPVLRGPGRSNSARLPDP